MIRELSENGQYICTTFRPELIPHAESYFGVFFAADKISTVKKRKSFFGAALLRARSDPVYPSVTADECQDFIEGEPADHACGQARART